MSFYDKVELICDADHRNKVMNRKFGNTGNMTNHDLQIYHIAIRLPVIEIVEIIEAGEGYANQAL